MIHYLKHGDHATTMPSTVRYGNTANGKFVLMDSIKYRYDSMGNICEVLENGMTVARYEYDSIGRLTREDNKHFNKTTLFAYDNNGNIISKYIYSFTLKETALLTENSCSALNYCYDSGSDRLLSYNGEIFEYDEIGNPTTYRGKSAAWAYGRQLQSFDGNTYTYDARGRRISKQHGTDEPIHFIYDSNGRLIQQSNGLEFIYDHTGVMGVIYNASTYFYRKNAQSDIIALLDKDGNVVVKYTYDAWGNNTVAVLDASATTIANLNPFRYRSYYYDTETNLYFLKTRYYDPEVARFMTIDGITYLNPDAVNGLNLYAYCGNNPVMHLDPNGTEWWNPTTWNWGAIGNWSETTRAVVGTALALVGAAITIATLPTAITKIGGGVLTQAGFSTMMYGGFMVASVFDSEVKSDMDAIGWTPLNTDAGLVAKSGSVSFYKGVPVTWLNLPSSFSFLGIFLDTDSYVDDITVNHEFGHNVQQMILGPLFYGIFVAFPSAYYCLNGDYLDYKNPLREKMYYSKVWERTADWFGGVDRKNYFDFWYEENFIFW